VTPKSKGCHTLVSCQSPPHSTQGHFIRPKTPGQEGTLRPDPPQRLPQSDCWVIRGQADLEVVIPYAQFPVTQALGPSTCFRARGPLCMQWVGLGSAQYSVGI
jgi:hypothetical protein